MNFSRQAKLNGFYIFWFLIISLAVSCGSAEQSETNLSQISPPTPQSGQPVEYGASLSEWEEATQTDGEQIENSDNEIVESGSSPAPELVQAAPSSDSYPAPEAEGTVSERGYPEAENASTAATEADGVVSNEEIPTTKLFTLNDIVYREIMWDALVPANFTADAIMAKYEDQLAQIEDGSPEGYELYTQMQEEFNNAPVNEAIDGSLVRLPGFIAPLEYTDDLITEFLLVPYFGACIHVPPPPANQTVLVKLSEGQGIKFEDAWYPFWVMGELTAEGASTELAEAGYYIENAVIELYSDDS